MIEGKSILLVEDDANLGFVIKDSLVDAGAKVMLAKDGVAGFEAFYDGKFDICILDVMMPEMDGIEACGQIRLIPELKDTLIAFFLT